MGFNKWEETTTEISLTDKAAERKATPIYSGCIKYFPKALAVVAKCSLAGQSQHNPDKPLAWDRSKSGDELDAAMRHLCDHSVNPIDDDGIPHIHKVLWRVLAFVEKTEEENEL
tara:strand:- start:429 stop:770 length:342 start_codon:yes stop_codon:yes gene_type:complete